MKEILIPLWQHLLLEAVVILRLFQGLHHDGPQRGRQEEAAVRAPLDGLDRSILPFELNHAFVLGAAAVVHGHGAPLDIPKDGEGPVQELVGHPRPEIANLDGALVWRETDLHGAAVVHLAVELALGLLRVGAGRHAHESKVLLGVKEHLLVDLAELGQDLLQLLLSRVWGQVSHIEAGAASKLFVRYF